MDPMFNEYGYKESPKQPLYNEEDFSINTIEELVLMDIKNFQIPEFVYLSTNLYKIIQSELLAKVSYSSSYKDTAGLAFMSIYTSAGPLSIKHVPQLENFCYVGIETSFEQIEWVRIQAEFEKIFLGEES
jgi:hypothetical protein